MRLSNVQQVTVAGGVLVLIFFAVMVARTWAHPTTPAPTGTARHACADFATLGQDLRDGVLTDVELRARTKKISDEIDASIDGRYATQLAARTMLAAATGGDATKFRVAMSDLETECAWVTSR
jgi:hypothetical protein